jgi:hypothetical protein
MNVNQKISSLIASQFPSFYDSEGPKFEAFLQAYYEWMESQGQALNYSRSLLDLMDIDSTTDQFIKYFRNEYIDLFPASMAADPRLVMKHVSDMYRTKGTKRAVELLFRIVFNEDVGIYIPGDHIFKTSAATWVTPRYIEVSDSPYLFSLVGKQVYNNSATAIVEDYVTRVLSNRVVNVLYISNLHGSFRYGQQVFCADLLTDGTSIIDLEAFNELTQAEQLSFSQLLTPDNAPTVFGSLSALGIINGGIGFSVGDVVETAQRKAKAVVVSTTAENGKVSFDLLNGGFGFSMNAVVTVAGGGGSGADFAVGGLADVQVYDINTDIISNYYNTQLDSDTSGINININSSTGNMTVGENITATGNVVPLDVRVVSGLVANQEVLHFTNPATYGTIDLLAIWSDHSLLYVGGTEANLHHANLVNGVELTGATTGAIVQINTVFPENVINGNAVVVSANSSDIVCNFVNGYFIANTTITGGTSGHTANVVSTLRYTNWNFPGAPFANTNLDQLSLGVVLVFYTLDVGTITFLADVNPGADYFSNPTVTVVEPLIAALQIPDGANGYYGEDANISATAAFANGIATGLQIIDSSLGFTPGEQLSFTSNSNQSSITASAIVDLNGIQPGYYRDNVGFPSDESFIEDDAYYQKFSYEILASRMLSSYQKLVMSLTHPSGLNLFGRFVDYHEMLDTESGLAQSSVVTLPPLATGMSTAAAVAQWIDAFPGRAIGSSSAAAVSQWIDAFPGSAAGTSTATGVS